MVFWNFFLVVASLASATTLPYVQIGTHFLPSYLDQRTKWFHVLLEKKQTKKQRRV